MKKTLKQVHCCRSCKKVAYLLIPKQLRFVKTDDYRFDIYPHILKINRQVKNCNCLMN